MECTGAGQEKDGPTVEQVRELAEQARAAARVDPAESARAADAAWALAQRFPNGPPALHARALARRARAVSCWAQARWSDALEQFETGAREAEEAGEPLLAAQIPILAIETLAQLGRYDEALRLARSLEERLRALGAEEDAAKVVANAGNIHFEREAHGEALRSWEQALAFFAERGQSVAVASLQVNIANVLTHLSRIPEARAMYEAARDTLEGARMEAVLAGVEGNLGFLLYVCGQYTDALQAFARARARFEQLGLEKDVAKCDREAADVYLELNLAPEAQETYERVLPLFEKLGMGAEVARCELGRAIALAARGREAEALEALERAEAGFRRAGNRVGVARAGLQRAELRRDPRAPAEATLRALRRIEREFRKHGIRAGAVQARLLAAEARVTAGESPVRALRRLRRETEEGALVALLWRIDAALARGAMNRGDTRAAVRHYRRAVEEIERARLVLRGDDYRIAFLQDKVRLYDELLALLLDRGTRPALREAFQLAERSKSRTLLEVLSGGLQRRGGEDPQHEELLKRLEALRAQLNWDYGRVQQIEPGASRLPSADAALPERVRRLERDYLQIQRQLQIAGSAPRARGAEHRQAAGPAGLDVAQLQELLDEDEQILEYVTTRDEIVAFVLSRRELRPVRAVASRAEVERQTARLRFQLQVADHRLWSGQGGQAPCSGMPVTGRSSAEAPAPGQAEGVLQALYEMLIEPVEPLLQGRRLTIIPHGLLHGVPFHALYDGERHLLDRWEVAYAPSASVWLRMQRRAADPAVGGPDGGAAGILREGARPSLIFGVSDPTLAHVREEVGAVGNLLPAAQVYEDEAATLASVPTEGEYDYIHFATHAVFRQDNPLFSGLRMADGWLIAHDLQRRRLECRLATLSACRTGVSAVAPGDEVLGLVRGFLHAGARAVMVSLWAADDRATAELMQDCYRRLAAGESRAAALRGAQQALRERYRHPYYWAAFALIGGR